jgi:glutathione peroxidase|tara:strand:- start:484 stop:1038 length:555 start_codon:yes stop_codon:yes gene_type:complete
MLKKTLITLLSIMTLTLNSQTSVDNSIHQFKVADIYGNIFDFSQLKGKKVMIVNTASKCGLTYQYEALQKLYSQYKDLNFVIVGFPSNDFLWQEPGSNDEIIDFCEQNYGVTFPMMSKITVKGTKKHPIYQFLTQKSKNNYKDSRVTWNFQKYLVNKQGRVEKIISPRTRPDSEEIVSWITDVD